MRDRSPSPAHGRARAHPHAPPAAAAVTVTATRYTAPEVEGVSSKARAVLQPPVQPPALQPAGRHNLQHQRWRASPLANTAPEVEGIPTKACPPMLRLRPPARPSPARQPVTPVRRARAHRSLVGTFKRNSPSVSLSPTSPAIASGGDAVADGPSVGGEHSAEGSRREVRYGDGNRDDGFEGDWGR